MYAGLKQKGFTIVELLIVIVVIAILAAITIVSYNGITMRARNNARIQITKNLYNLAQSYVATNGPSSLIDYQLDNSASKNPSCLGAQYTDLSPNNLSCYIEPSFNPGYIYHSSVSTALRTIGTDSAQGFPKLTLTYSDGTKATSSAPILEFLSDPKIYVDNVKGNYGMIITYLEGANQNCGFGKQLIYLNSSGGNYYFSTTTTAKNASYGSDYTECDYYFYPGV